MTKQKGRGIFTTKDIKKGDLIIADKAIATIQYKIGEQDRMIDECVKICKVGGILAIRMSYLFDGIYQNMKIPPLEIFI